MEHVLREKEILTAVFEGRVERELRSGRQRLTMIHNIKRVGYKKSKEKAWDRSN